MSEPGAVVISGVIGRAMRAGFRLVTGSEDGAALDRGPFNLIVSARAELDGLVWVHASFSESTRSGLRLPSWADVVRLKELVLGTDTKAILVIPPRDEYVNIAEVHHIWWCPKGDGLPDFTQGSGSL